MQVTEGQQGAEPVLTTILVGIVVSIGSKVAESLWKDVLWPRIRRRLGWTAVKEQTSGSGGGESRRRGVLTWPDRRRTPSWSPSDGASSWPRAAIYHALRTRLVALGNLAGQSGPIQSALNDLELYVNELRRGRPRRRDDRAARGPRVGCRVHPEAGHGPAWRRTSANC